MILPNIQAETTTTVLQSQGNANSNGSVLDLQPYKGVVTFGLAVGQITTGLGAANIDLATIQDSADNTTFANVTGGAFTAVINAANASNVGLQVKSFSTRTVRRYARVQLNVSGTNANLPVTAFAVGQLERV